MGLCLNVKKSLFLYISNINYQTLLSERGKKSNTTFSSLQPQVRTLKIAEQLVPEILKDPKVQEIFIINMTKIQRNGTEKTHPCQHQARTVLYRSKIQFFYLQTLSFLQDQYCTFIYQSCFAVNTLVLKSLDNRRNI